MSFTNLWPAADKSFIDLYWDLNNSWGLDSPYSILNVGWPNDEEIWSLFSLAILTAVVEKPNNTVDTTKLILMLMLFYSLIATSFLTCGKKQFTNVATNKITKNVVEIINLLLNPISSIPTKTSEIYQ